MREFSNVTQAACTQMASEMKTVLEINNAQFAQRIYEGYAVQRPEEFKRHLEMAVREQNVVTADCLEKVDTGKKLNRYAESHFAYVEPLEITLGYSSKNKIQTMQYVPILKVLEALLKHEDILSEILRNRKSNNGKYQDFCDGEAFSGNELFNREPSTLQLQMYYDDFTAANAIGLNTKRNKVGAVYYVLGNLSPKYRSKLDHIQLAMLCRSQYVKKYGTEKIFEPILSDIKRLETEGINILFDGTNYNFKGTISFLSADNLAAHGLGGYHENFSTVLRLCRTCTVTKHEMQDVFRNNEFTFRTPEMYDRHVAAVSQDRSLASVYGIKFESCLNELQYFHVVNGLPHDIAHNYY
jgi:hypothetical protein